MSYQMNEADLSLYKNGRIPSLDGLRGGAILLVLLGHGFYSLNLPHFPGHTLLNNGELGVKIFFVLSGFLIYNLSVGEIEKTGRFSMWQFYLRRSYRIWPLFYFYIACVSALLFMHVVDLDWGMIFSAGTFTWNYRHLFMPDQFSGANTNDYWIIAHYWTLALEEQFYITWPLLMVLFIRNKLLPALITILIIVFMLRIYWFLAIPDSRSRLPSMFHTGIDVIAAGVVLGEIIRIPKVRKWFMFITSKSFVPYLIILLLLIILPVANVKLGDFYRLTLDA